MGSQLLEEVQNGWCRFRTHPYVFFLLVNTVDCLFFFAFAFWYKFWGNYLGSGSHSIGFLDFLNFYIQKRRVFCGEYPKVEIVKVYVCEPRVGNEFNNIFLLF